MSAGPGAGTARIRMDTKQALFFVAYCVVLAAVGIVLLMNSTAQVVGVVLLVCSALVFYVKVLSGSGSAPCTSCGAALGDLQRRKRNPSILCTSCLAFHEGEAGKLWAVEPDKIAKTPLFPVRMPEQITWPAGCVVCGTAATRHLVAKKLRVNVGKSLSKTAGLSSVAAAVGGTAVAVSTTETSLSVPHCNDHDDGASLQESVDGRAIDIVFRSLPYQRLFCETNSMVSVPLNHYTRSTGQLARLFKKA